MNPKRIVVLLLAVSVAANAVLIWSLTGHSDALAPAPAYAGMTAKGEELAVYMGLLRSKTCPLVGKRRWRRNPRTRHRRSGRPRRPGRR